MKKAERLDALFQQAKESHSSLKRLSVMLQWIIPFNRPHRIRVDEISDTMVRASLPYRRKNLNHLKGIHACAIATLAEYTSGLFLLQRAGAKGYRIIMERLEVDYHYQARSGIHASFRMDENEYEERVSNPLKEQGKVSQVLEVSVKDEQDELIATAKVHWQLKDWRKTSAPRPE